MLDRRIADGTADFTQGPAMTRAQAIGAIEGRHGGSSGMREKRRVIPLLATGEMGIGNTTTSSAVAAALLGQPVERMTGRGAGLSDAGLARKLDAIRRGIAVNRPNADDPLDVLAKLGGLDIAGLCGMFLGGALHRVPIVMDGFISGVAALCAARLCPNAGKAAIFASHASSEPAARLVLEALGKQPAHHGGHAPGRGDGRGRVHSAVGYGAGRLSKLLFVCGGRHRAVYPAMLTLVDRRFGQRQERVCRAARRAKRPAALLRGDHACLGRGEREARGAPSDDAAGKAV